MADPLGRIVFLGWTENLEHSIWLSDVDPGEFFVVFPETGERVDSWSQGETGLHLTVSPVVREYGGTHELFTHISDEFSEYDNYVDSADQQPGRFTFPDDWDPPTTDRPDPDTVTPEVRPDPDTVTPEVRPDPDTVTPEVRPDPDTVTPEIRPDPDTVTPELRPDPDTVTPEVRPDPDTVTPELRPDPDTVTPEVRPDPDTVTPEVRPDPDTVTPELRPDPDTVTPELRPDPDTVTPELRPDPDTVTPEVRPDPDTVTPELRPDPDTVTPEVRPDPDTVTPEVRPDPDTVTPELRPDPDTVTPEVRPDPDTVTPELRPDPDTVTPELRPDPDTVTPEVRPDPDTVTPELRPDPDTVTPEVRPDPGTVTPEVRPDPDTVTPEVRPDPDTVTPEVRPDPDSVTPELRPDPDTVTPEVRPDPDTVTPEVRPDPDPVGPTTPGARPAASIAVPDVRSAGPAQSLGERRGMIMSAAALCQAAGDGRLTGVDERTVRDACEAAAVARSPWTVWGEWTRTDTEDSRYGGLRKGRSERYTVGLDRRVGDRSVAGLAIEFGESEQESFGGGMRSRSDSLTVRPYAVHGVGSTPLVLDASAAFDFIDYRQDILFLSGEHDSFAFSGTVGVSTQTVQGGFVIRPRLSVSYARIWHDAFILEGDVAGLNLRVRQDDARLDYGAVSASLEFSRPFRTPGGMAVTPYVEFEGQFAFERPNDGRILTPTLDLVHTDSTGGSIRFGARARVTPEIGLVAAGAYHGVGSPDLSIWEWRFYLSRRF